jgi:hypothetical protein
MPRARWLRFCRKFAKFAKRKSVTRAQETPLMRRPNASINQNNSGAYATMSVTSIQGEPS